MCRWSEELQPVANLDSAQEFNRSINTITAGAWASGGALNTARWGLGGAMGTQTAGLVAGGATPTPKVIALKNMMEHLGQKEIT